MTCAPQAVPDGRGEACSPSPDGLDVLFVNMPFGPLRQPSIGLALVQASVPDLRSRVLYLNLRFADRLGWELYRDVSGRRFGGTALVGEWLFAPALYDEAGRDDRRYLAEVVAAEAGAPLDDALIERLFAARRLAEGFLDECAEEIAALAPRMIGFTSVFQQHVPSLALARRLAQRSPGTPLVFGGANCEGPMGRETARRYPFLAAVVCGEGEIVFPELARRFLAGEPIEDLPGVVTAAASTEEIPAAPRTLDLDDLPVPSFDDFFAAWRELAPPGIDGPRLLFESSRGCWWGAKKHCTFCGLNGSSMSFRSKSAPRALAELAALVRRHPGVPVMVVDNILDMRYFRDFLPALADSAIDVALFYEVKANLRRDQLALLARAGVREIQPGVESLSDDVLARMGKGVRALQNVQLLKWCLEVGIWPSWNFLWGFPGEPTQEYERMAALLPLLSHLPPPGAVCRIRLDRFSPNFERAAELGFTAVEPCPAYGFIHPLPAAAVANLAYYFRYDYADGRRPEGYAGDLVAAVGRWQREFAASSLVRVDRGDELWIWDLRPIARRSLTILSGAERALYLACDGVQSLGSLARELAREMPAATVDGITELAAPLVDDGLLLRDGDRLLALAVAGRPAAPAAGDWRLFTR